MNWLDKNSQPPNILGFDEEIVKIQGESMIKKLRGIAQSKSSKISVIQNSKNGSNYGVVGGNFNSNVKIG